MGRSTAATNCSCNSGYYETGADTLNCGKCLYPCLNCTGSSTNCTSCATTLDRGLKPTCICNDNFYDNNSSCVGC